MKPKSVKKPVVHKLRKNVLGWTWGCDTDGVKPWAVNYYWAMVTCKRCLKARK